MAYTEDCADLGVKVTRICKSFEGTVAVSVRSTVGLGACDDLSPEWRKVTWEAVKEKVDGHFKLTAKLDDLRPVHSRALILDSYDSFASMHVALTVFVSALAKKDAELGTGALPATTKRDIVLKALELGPLCKHWLENITFESAAEILKFLLENVSECVAFERKFGHAPGCRTRPVYKKGAETKIHTAFRTRSQRRHIWRFRRPSPSFLRLSPNQQYRWRPSRATSRRQRGLSGPCTPVQTAEDALTKQETVGLPATAKTGASRVARRSAIESFAHTNVVPAPRQLRQLNRHLQREAVERPVTRRSTGASVLPPHPTMAGAATAGADNKSDFYSCPPRVACCVVRT